LVKEFTHRDFSDVECKKERRVTVVLGLLNIYWDISQLEEMKSKLQKKRDEFAETQNTFIGQQNLLTSVWKGDAGDLVNYRLSIDKDKFETIVRHMDWQISVLEYAINRYRQCENNVLNKVRRVG